MSKLFFSQNHIHQQKLTQILSHSVLKKNIFYNLSHYEGCKEMVQGYGFNLGSGWGIQSVPQAHELGLHHGCGLVVLTGAVSQKWLYGERHKADGEHLSKPHEIKLKYQQTWCGQYHKDERGLETFACLLGWYYWFNKEWMDFALTTCLSRPKGLI